VKVLFETITYFAEKLNQNLTWNHVFMCISIKWIEKYCKILVFSDLREILGDVMSVLLLRVPQSVSGFCLECCVLKAGVFWYAFANMHRRVRNVPGLLSGGSQPHLQSSHLSAIGKGGRGARLAALRQSAALTVSLICCFCS
jgi:hypothetical protein